MQLISAIAVIAAIASGGVVDEPADRTGIASSEMSAYVDQLISQKRLITDLKVRIIDRKIVFDVSHTANKSEIPWLIQINISDGEYRAFSKRYTADGYENSIHRQITANRKKLHSTVWVQKSSGSKVLTLPDGPIPASGDLGKDLEPLNELLLESLRANNIPGATVAVASEGKIIFERGFGYSDLEPPTPMAPNTTIRIASISKPITAVAVLLLVEDGKLQLDDLVIDFLTRDRKFSLPADADPAWNRITIRNLLQHSGGWNRDKSKDTMFELAEVTRSAKLDKIARIPDVVRYQMSQPLDFEPGSEYQYSNVGYCLLGRVIEAASEQSYESFVTRRILIPAGMTQTRLGKTRLSDRADDEAHYYTQTIKTYPAVWEVASDKTSGGFEMVSAPYGQWDLEVMDAHGGWTSTASDLVRFAMAMESPDNPLLTSDSLRVMKERPTFAGPAEGSWYGLGWDVRPIGGLEQANMWHIGLISGSSTILVKRWDNCVWAVLFNTDQTKDGKACSKVIDGPMHSAVSLSLRLVEQGRGDQTHVLEPKRP